MNDGHTNSDEKGILPLFQWLAIPACGVRGCATLVYRPPGLLSVSLWSTIVLRCRPSLALERRGGCREQAVSGSQGGRLALALSMR